VKTVIFSDTHLTPKFEEKKYAFLADIIADADQVIINGDFWDSDHCTLDEFVVSPWKKLFPSLLAKNTIYLYGNHDTENINNENTYLFSVEQKENHILYSNGLTLFIEHGHRLDPYVDRKRHSRKMNFIEYLYSKAESVGYKLFGYYSKYMFPDKLHGWLIFREFAKSNLEQGKLFVFGHVHMARDERKNGLIVLGDIKNGYGSYLVVTEETVELKKVRYAKWYPDPY